MNRQQQLINNNATRSAELIADIAERQHHRMIHGEPVPWQAPPSSVPAPPSDAEQIAVERMLRESRGQQTLQAALQTALESLADQLGITTGRIERELKQQIAALREEIGQLRAELAVTSSVQRGEVALLKRSSDAA